VAEALSRTVSDAYRRVISGIRQRQVFPKNWQSLFGQRSVFMVFLDSRTDFVRLESQTIACQPVIPGIGTKPTVNCGSTPLQQRSDNSHSE
jgi:hypothetical protein